jgi:ACR3 family arsenite transporter
MRHKLKAATHPSSAQAVVADEESARSLHGQFLSLSYGRSLLNPQETDRARIVMSAETASPMGLFERYLSLWIALCITAGVVLGVASPDLFGVIATLEYASVNLVVAAFIWVMIYPMMVNVDFASLKDVGKKPKGLCITLAMNWLVKPFSMAALGILFFEYLFAGMVDPQTAKEYIAGMILLGVAPCTAMVFVWSQLVRGDANYTPVQVSINDIIMVFAFAPIAAFLLGVTDIIVPWRTLLLSVVLYVVIPLAIGYLTRKVLDRSDTHEKIASFTAKLKPYSIVGLLATVVLLFGFQAQTIVEKPFVIFLIAIPLLIQSYGIFAIAYGWGYLWRVPFNTAAPAALISTSNFFELAVAVAIGLFGLNSGAALATVVGVLVEVPVMLSLVAFANRTRAHFT